MLFYCNVDARARNIAMSCQWKHIYMSIMVLFFKSSPSPNNSHWGPFNYSKVFHEFNYTGMSFKRLPRCYVIVGGDRMFPWVYYTSKSGA